jgi:hypothetical protein
MRERHARLWFFEDRTLVSRHSDPPDRWYAASHTLDEEPLPCRSRRMLHTIT